MTEDEMRFRIADRIDEAVKRYGRLPCAWSACAVGMRDLRSYIWKHDALADLTGDALRQAYEEACGSSPPQT